MVRNITSRGGSRTAATSKMKLFVIVVNGFQPLAIITKSSILDFGTVLDPPLTRLFLKGGSKIFSYINCCRILESLGMTGSKWNNFVKMSLLAAGHVCGVSFSLQGLCYKFFLVQLTFYIFPLFIIQVMSHNKDFRAKILVLIIYYRF